MSDSLRSYSHENTAIREARRLKIWAYLALFSIAMIGLTPLVILLIKESGGRSLSLWVSALVTDLPTLWYLFATYSAAELLDRMGEGELFSAFNVQRLRRIGRALVGGGLTAIFLVPMFRDLPTRGMLALGVFVTPEVMVVVLLGAALQIVARLYAKSVAMRLELSEIL